MVLPLNQALQSDCIHAECNEISLRNYTDSSVDDMISQIIKPILKTMQQLPKEGFPLKKKHVDSMKNYQKELKRVTEIDHTEVANRALGSKGIIGESGIDSIEARASKAEWRCCLNITERLGSRLGTIIKDNPDLGDVFSVPEVERESSIYPLVVHLLKSIDRELR